MNRAKAFVGAVGQTLIEQLPRVAAKLLVPAVLGQNLMSLRNMAPRFNGRLFGLRLVRHTQKAQQSNP